MAFSGYRDIKQKRQKELNTKQDKQAQFKAVIVDENGLQSGSGSIWANQNKRRVWIMPIGGVQPFQVICVRITPVIGLGVIVGYADPLSRTLEVLRTDYEFYLETNTIDTAYESPSNLDFLPGGRLQLWLASKLLEPLATYPQSTGLKVNVIRGYYPYAGVRTFYPGAINLTLVQNPNAGQHYYAGLYLDAANTLQVVYGASVVLATTPPEPTWPDGAFQLCVVRINDTQTKIVLSQDTDTLNDIIDRRMLWVDVDSFGAGWPYDHILTVSPTNPGADYTTIGAAITAASAGDVILLDAATYNEAVAINKVLTLIGLGVGSTIITNVGAATITITAANVTLRYLTVNNTSVGATGDCVLLSTSASDVVIDECTIEKVSGAATLATAVHVTSGTNHVILNSKLRCTTGTSRYGLLADTGANSTTMINGRCQGSTKDVRTNNASAAITLQNVILPSATATSPSYEEAAGAIGGNYYLAGGDLVFIDNSGIVGRVWLEDTSARIRKFFPDLPTANAAAGTGDAIYLEAGTYTLAAGETLSTNNLTIYAASPGNVTITLSVNDTITLNVTGDNVTLRNLTINHTGAGSVGYPVAFDGDNFTLDNCTLGKTGAPTLGAALYQFGGTGAKVFNSFITASGATTNRAYYNTGATGAIEFWGGKLSGTQADVWSDVTTSTIATYGTILEHGLVDHAGIYPRPSVMPMPTAPIMLNGHPLIWQRGTSFAAIANAAYSADRYKYGKSGLMVHTVSRSTDVPTMAQVGALLQYSLLTDCTTVDASIAAGDHCEQIYTIEGFNFLKIAQQQFTIPVWIKATKTGIYCVAFRNSVADRSYVAEITVNTTATWEPKAITVPASPSAGTWDYAAGAGLFISLSLACGSTFQTTAGAWQTGNFLGTANQVNACDDTANDTRIIFGKPVQGPYARPFENDNFSQIVDYCQRYYQKSYDLATDPATNTSAGAESYQTRTAIAASTAGVLRPGKIRFAPRLRTGTPTVTPYAVDGTANAVSNVSGGTVRTGATITANLGETGFSRVEISNADADAITADQLITFHWTANADY